jgi:predicted Zn-dependent protease with MMP-like domain
MSEHLRSLVQRAYDFLDDGDPEMALDAADEAVEGWPGSGEAWLVKGLALADGGEEEPAMACFERACALQPDLVDAYYARVEALLDRGLAEEALEVADEALSVDTASAVAHHARGLVLTQLDRMVEADESFRRAAAIDPEAYFPPFRLKREDFDRAAEEVLASLPSRFRQHLRNVEVAVEDVPGPDLLEEGLGHDLLGLYQGQTIHAGDWEMPGRILLFQRNLENISCDRDEILKEIRDTVLHEVGHHLGMEEDDLLEIEQGEP